MSYTTNRFYSQKQISNGVKICIATNDKTLNQLISPSFEDAAYFLFINTRSNKLKAVRNKPGSANGFTAAHLVADGQPDLVICGNIQPNSFDFLIVSGIKIISGIFGITAEEAITRYRTGRIKPVEVRIPPSGKGRTL
jgi:predicted Fe-Mo cluster-binding NifX family protein